MTFGFLDVPSGAGEGPLNFFCYKATHKKMVKFRKSVTSDPTVSREEKKWSDKTPPFILNGNIICFVVFLDVFSAKMVTKKLTNPPPLI